MNEINNKIKKDGLNQLKHGDNWIKILETLRDIFEEQDGRNKNKILKRYLNKWTDKVKRLKNRDDKLQKALDEMDKRQIIGSGCLSAGYSRGRSARCSWHPPSCA